MKNYNFFNSGYFLLLFFLTSCDVFKSSGDDFDLESKKVTEIIKASTDSIQAPNFFPDKDVRKYLHQEFHDFYELRDFKLAWVDFDEPNSQVEDLLEAIDEAYIEGLEPESYKVDEVENLLEEVFKIESRKEKRKRLKAKKSKNEEIANEAKKQDTLKLYNLVRLDFLLTSTYLTYASHLLSGKIHPDENEAWFPTRKKKELAPYLTKALANKVVKTSLEDLVPKHQKYEKLKGALAYYRDIQTKEAGPEISVIKELKPGSSNDQVPALRRKLAITEDLAHDGKKSKDSVKVDEELLQAIKRFQLRNGLIDNGELDEATAKALNVPIEERIKQIKLNMERMRWLPDSFENKYVLVNIPEYMLRVYNGKKVELEMKVIVGKTYNATPIFSDEIEYLVFSPTWTVPKSIGVEEMLPKLQEDPEWLTKRNFKLYDSWDQSAEPIDPRDIKWKDVDEENFNFRIVENPGKANALGSVKFMFPNKFDIYLHDTPTGHLFEKKERSFSHGCIRVEKPLELSEYFLKDKKDWDRSKIQEAMNKEEPETVKISEKIPIHLVYWTAWVDDNEILNFRDDIYSRDKNQIKQMEQKEKQMILTGNQNK